MYIPYNSAKLQISFDICERITRKKRYSLAAALIVAEIELQLRLSAQ